MSLFPAYSSNGVAENIENEPVQWQYDSSLEKDDVLEAELLASDVEEERVSVCVDPKLPNNDDFYMDCKMDCGNLGVSTLYYPGRPQYESSSGPLHDKHPFKRDRKRQGRYFNKHLPDDSDAAAVSERAAAYRRLLDNTPHDVVLWERYIDFMEWCASEKEAVEAAELAVAKAGDSRQLRARLYSALRRTLPAQSYAERLQKSLAIEQDVHVRLELWIELMKAVGSTAEGGVQAVTAVAGAALRDTRSLPGAYPDLLYEFGVYIRAGGLWEQLVQLIELVVAMNYPHAKFPPPRDTEQELLREKSLRDIENKAIDSGLPLNAVWVRVERARGAAHWRPCAESEALGPTGDGGDPQRVPLAHDVADLLQPVVNAHQLFRLSVRLLMLAKVPLVCGKGWSARGDLGCRFECVEELLPLVSEARLLNKLHAAHAETVHAQRLLALFVDPPHYFSDEYGFLSWVNALWEGACEWATGTYRCALLCWRLRWLRALVLAAGIDEGGDAAADGVTAEVRRMRNEGRSLLRRWAGAAPLPFAEWARLEHAASGAQGALRAAHHALRAALADNSLPHYQLLYIARVMCEVSNGEGRPDEQGVRALVAAVLRRTDLIDAVLRLEHMELALNECEKQCESLESKFESKMGDDKEDELRILLPSEAEWGTVRAMLVAPARRSQLLAGLLAHPHVDGGAAARYWEQCACVIANASRSAAIARALSLRCTHNHYLAVAGAGAPLWSRAKMPADRSAPSPTGVAAFASLLPALLRALETSWAPEESDAFARVCRRVLGARGSDCGPLGALLRLEAEGHAQKPRLPHALYAALAAAPHHKWLYVRGAAWCGGEADALGDALLDKLLRLHALRNELEPLERLQPQTKHAEAEARTSGC